MKAVMKTGGKQYIVQEKDTLRVEKIDGEEGSKISIKDVLLTVDSKGGVVVGTPVVEGASVEAMIKSQGREKKVIVGKSKAKKRYHKRQGHRQKFTELEVTAITTGK